MHLLNVLGIVQLVPLRTLELSGVEHEWVTWTEFYK